MYTNKRKFVFEFQVSEWTKCKENNWTNLPANATKCQPNQLLHYDHEQDKNWWWKWCSCCILVLLFVIIILNNADDDDDDCQLQLKRTWWADINANKCKHLYLSLCLLEQIPTKPTRSNKWMESTYLVCLLNELKPYYKHIEYKNNNMLKGQKG